MADMLDRPLPEILDMPEIKHVVDTVRLGVAAPSMPVVIVQAATDRIISVHDIDRLAATYRKGGTDVTYHCDGFSEHILLHPMSAPWRYGGSAIDSPCSSRSRTTRAPRGR